MGVAVQLEVYHVRSISFACRYTRKQSETKGRERQYPAHEFRRGEGHRRQDSAPSRRREFRYPRLRTWISRAKHNGAVAASACDTSLSVPKRLLLKGAC